MAAFFIRLLNMSISACWLVLAVVLLRAVIRKAPKYIRCILWALVGIRLICPFSLKSIFSLVPSAETIPQNILYAHTPEIDTGSNAVNNAVNPMISESLSPQVGASVNPVQIVMTLAGVVWLAGAAVMLTYGVISYLRLRRRTAASISLRDNIRLCDDIDSPFILGIVRPHIFVPSAVSSEQLIHIEAHEKAHLARKDHWWKPIGFAVLAVHWFNPAVWLAYIMLCRDIELACDERVIKDMDMGSKRDYSHAMLSCSIPHRAVAACPLAFGEVGVKERIKSVLNYKKPTFWIIIASVAVCIVTAVCFMTNPTSSLVDSELEAYLHTVILEEGRSQHTEGNFACEAHDILGAERDGDKIIVYALVMYHEYSFANGRIVSESGWHVPSVITIDTGGSAYSYEYWESDNGTRYVPSIREKFPWYLEERAINIHRTAERHKAECIRQAEEYYNTEYVDPYANTVWTTQAVQAPDIPPLEETAQLEPERAREVLAGCTRDELISAWGEPAYELSGMYGEVWEVGGTDSRVTVHYLTDGDSMTVYNVIISDAAHLAAGVWKNVSKNDMGMTMSFSNDGTGTTFFRGYEMPFTWLADANSIDVMYAPSAHVYFELRTEDNMTKLISGDDYYVMIPEECYAGYVNIVEINNENWQNYFKIIRAAKIYETNGVSSGELFNMFRLKNKYAAGFVTAEIYLKYSQSEAAEYRVVYDTVSGGIQVTELRAGELSKKGYAAEEENDVDITKFMDYNAEMQNNGLALPAKNGCSIDGTFSMNGTQAEWQCFLCSSIEVTEISGTLVYTA